MELDFNCNTSLRKLVKHVWLNEAKDKNFAFSPFSIYSILSLLASGSDGRTLEQLLGFLNRKDINDLNDYVSEIINSYSSNKTTKGDGPIISFVSCVFVDDSCTLQPSFQETASSIYKAQAKVVDFINRAEEIREKVNAWVKKRTKGLISDLLPQGSPNESTRLLLVNALYFKGSWEEDQFNPELTENSKFYLLEQGTSVEVPFMRSYQEDFYISCFDSFKVLGLPYKQATTTDLQKRCLSMYIFLPNERDGLADLIEKVSSESPNFLESHLPKNWVSVRKFKIPKFKILFGFEMSRVLRDDLGLDLPFNPREVELTKMVSTEDGNVQRLCVSKAIHKCFIEVDEQGTEAAASSAFDNESYCLFDDPEPVPIVDFVADHPFMFMIRDDVNGVVLFMGHLLNPSLD